MRIKTSLLFIMLCGILSAATPDKRSECWRNPETGAWEIGFFADFAVYEGLVWNYESLKETRKGRDLTLRNGNETLRMRIRQRNDSLCDIRIGREKPKTYQLLTQKRLPPYPTPDERPFTDNGYAKDSVTITGYCTGCRTGHTPTASISIRSFGLSDEPEETITTADSSGRFRSRIPVCNAQMVSLSGPVHVSFPVTPGAEYYLYIDKNGERIYAMGKDARVVNEILSLDTRHSFYIEEGMQMDDTAFLQAIKQRETNVRREVAGRIAAHPFLSARARSLAEQSMRHALGSEIMQRRFLHRTTPMLPELLHYAEEAVLGGELLHPLTLSENLSSFLTDYVGYCNQSTLPPLFPADAHYLETCVSARIAAGELQLSDSDRVALKDFSSLAPHIPHGTPDSLLSEAYKKTCRYLLRTWYPRLGKIEMDLYRDVDTYSKLRTIASLEQMPRALRDYACARLAVQQIEMLHTALPEALFDTLRAHLSPTLGRAVEATQHRFSVSPYADIQQSLGDAAACSGLTDGETILRQLLLPLRGKAVYLDIWGSWCSPCKYEMRDAASVKEALKGHDVVFLYLANRTTDASWKNTIRDLGCHGPQTIHYNLPASQQATVEEYLGVHSYPSYFLFDKTGRRVEKASRPREKENLIREIRQIIQK